MIEYMLRVHIKTNVVTWNNSGGKCRRFSEEHPKCGRFYKTIYMPLLYHKHRRLPVNTRELECIWPKMQWENFFTVKKTFIIFRNVLVIFRNPFHSRHEEFIIFIIVYFLLHYPQYSVFLCVCNVNVEEIFLYFMMLNPWLVSFVMTT